MALNRETGEIIQGLGHMFRVVPTDKWATTQYGAPHFLAAHEHATQAFKSSIGKFCNPGEKIQLSRDNVVVQEYPLLGKVAYVFELKLASMTEEHVVAYVCDIDPRLLEALRLSGEWRDMIAIN
jgi:hypothetical protein